MKKSQRTNAASAARITVDNNTILADIERECGSLDAFNDNLRHVGGVIEALQHVMSTAQDASDRRDPEIFDIDWFALQSLCRMGHQSYLDLRSATTWLIREAAAQQKAGTQ